jgi:hypothetical protein
MFNACPLCGLAAPPGGMTAHIVWSLEIRTKQKQNLDNQNKTDTLAGRGPWNVVP